MKKFLSALIIFIAALSLVNIQNVSAEMYQQGAVYIFYSREGDAAVRADDVNANGVPDMVEDIATQLNAAREVLHDEFGFPDPFGSKRYKNVNTIEIDIMLKKDMHNSNGLAFSNARKSKHDPNVKSVYCFMASVVDPRKNPTPIHEYFHILQYGATYFRNAWYLEGMAQWAQDAIQKNKKYPENKNFAEALNDKAFEEEVFKVKYKTSQLLWYPMAIDLKDKNKIPKQIMKKYHYADGSPVFEDNIFYGPNVIKQVLLEMKTREDDAAVLYGGRRFWIRDGVNKPPNNPFIMDCVRKVYAAQK